MSPPPSLKTKERSAAPIDGETSKRPRENLRRDDETVLPFLSFPTTFSLASTSRLLLFFFSIFFFFFSFVVSFSLIVAK